MSSSTQCPNCGRIFANLSNVPSIKEIEEIAGAKWGDTSENHNRAKRILVLFETKLKDSQ